MSPMEIKSRVGADGVLTIVLPLGLSEANREVKVVVESADNSIAAALEDREEWKQFVKNTAGCISDPTFELPPQGEYEQRRIDCEGERRNGRDAQRR
jgi:hypothetical protein